MMTGEVQARRRTGCLGARPLPERVLATALLASAHTRAWTSFCWAVFRRVWRHARWRALWRPLRRTFVTSAMQLGWGGAGACLARCLAWRGVLPPMVAKRSEGCLASTRSSLGTTPPIRTSSRRCPVPSTSSDKLTRPDAHAPQGGSRHWAAHLAPRSELGIGVPMRAWVVKRPPSQPPFVANCLIR